MKVYIITLENPEKTVVYAVGAKDEERALELIGEVEKITEDVYNVSGGVDVESTKELPAIAKEEFCTKTFDNSYF
jgi:hypothetical protein